MGAITRQQTVLSRLFTDMWPEDQKEFLPDLKDTDDFIVSVTDALRPETTLPQEEGQDAVEKGEWVNYAVITDNDGLAKDLEDTEDMVGSQDVSLTMSQALSSNPMIVGSVTQGSTDDKEPLDTETEEVTLDYFPVIEADDY